MFATREVLALKSRYRPQVKSNRLLLSATFGRLRRGRFWRLNPDTKDDCGNVRKQIEFVVDEFRVEDGHTGYK